MDGEQLPGVELGVHPLADIFPMLGENELADLAADIKANGQQVPIMLDAPGKLIVDGRNRLAACQIAGVDPWLERLAPDADPLAVIVSLNVKRRNLTAGQRAIAAAEAWIYAQKEGRVQEGAGRPKSAKSWQITKPRDYFAAQFSVNTEYIRFARDLWADDPQAALAVRRGADLQAAHRDLMQRLGRLKAQDNRLRDLERDRPDLADQVRAGELEIDAAVKQAKAEADELKQQRWAVTVNLIEAVGALDRDPGTAEDIARLFDRDVEIAKGSPKITAGRLQNASDYLAALAELWEGHDASTD